MYSNGHRHPPIEVCISQHNILVADHLCSLLAKERLFRLVLEQSFVRIKATAKRKPVFLVDITSLGVRPFEFLLNAQKKYPNASLLVLYKDVFDDSLVQLLRLGVLGFIRHSRVNSDLKPAVLIVSQGQLWISPGNTERHWQAGNSSIATHSSILSRLTTRERQVMDLITTGASNKEVAASLSISTSTVKFHLSHIFSKLGVHGRLSLAQNGLISVTERVRTPEKMTLSMSRMPPAR